MKNYFTLESENQTFCFLLMIFFLSAALITGILAEINKRETLAEQSAKVEEVSSADGQTAQAESVIEIEFN